MTAIKSIGLEQARINLPSVIAQASSGAISMITRHGKPVAAVVPLSALPVRTSGRLLALRGSGKGLWGTKPSAIVDALREEWS